MSSISGGPKFEIPARSSSKRSRSKSQDLSLEELKEEDRELTEKLARAYKKYWTDRHSALQVKQKSLRLRSKISMKKQEGNEWEATKEGQVLVEEAKATDLHCRIAERGWSILLERQATLDSAEKAEGIAFVKLNVTSFRGLGLKANTGERKREKQAQQQMREELIQLSGARNPNPLTEEIWCHITNTWKAATNCKAGHIFSYEHGVELMDAIFGREPGSESELFSPLNGVMMWDAAEKKLDKGHLVIVPDLEPDASASQVAEWHVNQSRGYKIRVVNPKDELMGKFIPGETSRKWRDLDNQVIQFRSEFRPRSRYLYFHYLTSMLRRAWTSEVRSEALVDEGGKRYWATPGPYLRSRFLRAFVDEIGHEFEEVVRGGDAEGAGATFTIHIEEGEGEAAIAVEAEQILLSNRDADETRDDDEDESEDSDSPDFEGFSP